jgi:molybdopterin-containing oxidoreductase family iron-sulfur binding subunit
MSKIEQNMTKRYWRSLDDLASTRQFRESSAREFPEGAEELALDGVSRRSFLGLMGASMGLSGLVGAGCIRKPTQYILPYTRRPEDLLPGETRYFATTTQFAGSVMGLLVASSDGRPTKVEGNPRHPLSMGGTTVFAQASVLDVYDPDRSQSAHVNGEVASLADALAAVGEAGAAIIAAQGAGTVLVVPDLRSPTFTALVDQFRALAPQLTVVISDETARTQQRAGLTMVGASSAQPVYHLDRARVVLSLDSDFLGVESDSLRNSKLFARTRRPESESDAPSMSRLYVVEPAFTCTGATADNRLQVAPSQIGDFMRALIQHLGTTGASLPATLQSVGANSASERVNSWAAAVGADLTQAGTTAAILVGDRQPAWIHAAAVLLQQALGSIGTTVELVPQDARIEAPTLIEWMKGGGTAQNVVIVGANPVYDAPSDVDVAALISGATTSVQLSYHPDETSALVKVHLPMSHVLESWGDARGTDRSVGIQQPLIDPLFESINPIEFLAAMLPDSALATGFDTDRDGEIRSAYAQVRRYWRQVFPLDFEPQWRTTLHEGVLVEPPRAPATYALSDAAFVAPAAQAAPSGNEFEIVFALDNKVLDGRYANNAWLQELPDPITKLTWDNAALINPVTAREMGIRFATALDNADVPVEEYAAIQTPFVTITVNGRTMEIPAMPTPGVAANVVVLPLGYGRQGAFRVARFEDENVGFNVASLRASDALWMAAGATVSVSTGTYKLATTQDHGSMEGRPMAREATVEQYQANPVFVTDNELMPDYRLTSLWEPPNRREGQQWGMSIDLTTCTGCNVCTIACQSENNISVVGKERIAQGREMAWIRLDRYFAGDAAAPDAIMQPVACMHCELAPCEQVCPVAATVHGPEGTNDMAYNRCIGTRYCANNCPYKVRRYNFFAFAKENDQLNPLLRLQKNPDVTVRFRGVMEKCSYCIQRVNRAKVQAKVNGNDIVQDGAITPACAQACPSDAIVFGDINDANSRVSQMKRRNRDYAILSWLNIHPRTTYLAKIRNPNPALAGV